MATLNVRSLTSKCASFLDLALSKKLDVVAITETWLTTKETSADLADITPQGSNFLTRLVEVKQVGCGFYWGGPFKCYKVQKIASFKF